MSDSRPACQASSRASQPSAPISAYVSRALTTSGAASCSPVLLDQPAGQLLLRAGSFTHRTEGSQGLDPGPQVGLHDGRVGATRCPDQGTQPEPLRADAG